ncbi:hypothetical protein ABKV19_007155, partial [Rosa sericea]
GYPYCRGYRWVDEMAGGSTVWGRIGKPNAYAELTMYGPNCEICRRLMCSYISQSEDNFGRPYWYCYGFP